MGSCLEKLERVRSRALWLLHCIINNVYISSIDIKNRIYYNKNYENYPKKSEKLCISIPEDFINKLSYMDNYLSSMINMTNLTIHKTINIITSKQPINVGLNLDGYSDIATAFNTVSILLTDSDFVSKSLYKISLLLSTIEYQTQLSTLINCEIGNNIAANIVSTGIDKFPIESLLALEFLIINDKVTIDITPVFNKINNIKSNKYAYLKAKIALLLSILISHTNVTNRLQSADILLNYLTHKYPTIRQLVVDGLVLLPFLCDTIIDISNTCDFKLTNINNNEELKQANKAVEIIRKCILDNIN